MKCPRCSSTQIRRNGYRESKQNYICVKCGRQFLDTYTVKGYSQAVREECLDLYKGGMALRAIERATGVCHNTVINWVRQAGLPPKREKKPGDPNQPTKPKAHRGYPLELREQCLAMHQQGMSLREIARLKGVSHNAVGKWTRAARAELASNQDSSANSDSASKLIRN